MRNIVPIFLVCILTWLSTAAQNITFTRTSENDTVLKRTLTTDDGLPQNTPTAMLQTRDGYIWIATFGGLARFDGLAFTIFTTTNAPDLPSNRLMALLEDKEDGTLWIGSDSGDLCKYQNGTFTTVQKNIAGNQSTVILHLYEDQHGLIWIGATKGLFIYNKWTNEIMRFTDGLWDPKLQDISVTDFATDKDGNIWMTASISRRLIRYSDGKFTNSDGKFTMFDIPKELVDKQSKTQTNAYGHILLSSLDGIYSFDGVSATRLTPPEVTSLPPPPKGGNTVFYNKNQIFHVTVAGVEAFSLPPPTPDTTIRSTFHDNEGNFWLGTQTQLIQYKKRTVNILRVTDRDGIKNSVSSIIGYPDGTIWMSSIDYLIQIALNEQPKAYKTDILITSLAIEPLTGDLLIGGANKILKFKNDKLEEYQYPGFVTSIRSDYVLFVDREDTLWVGTKESGLMRHQNGRVETFTTANGLVSDKILVISQDSQGAIWVGTKGGLSKLKDGQFQNFTTENGLANNYVREIYEDQDGTIWIGTYGGGITRYKNGSFFTINQNNGLAENIASRILTDENDNFWILGNRGIYSVNRNDLNALADEKINRIFCVVYGKNDGMMVSEGNGTGRPAGWKNVNGKLWFPMIQGGIIIPPTTIWTTAPPVYIEKVKVNHNEMSGQNVVLHSGEQGVEIEYTGVTFSKPEQLHFRYKLEGFDKEWREVGTRRVAYYPYLPPGNYTFKVSTSIGETSSLASTAILPIIVNTPFWQTPGFYAFSAVALFGLIVFGYQLRLGNLHRTRIKQREYTQQLITAHESERKRIAGELHDGLGHSLLIIKNWASLAKTKIDKGLDVKGDLKDISDAATNALEETRAISTNLRPVHLQRFGLTSSLQHMIKAVRDSSQIKIAVNLINIDNLFDSNGELSIFRIVQEALNNVARHSGANNAAVRIKRFRNLVTIDIVDNGKGFDTGLHNTKSEELIDFGMNNIRQRTELLGGTYSIKSTVGFGTRILISLPLKHDEKR